MGELKFALPLIGAVLIILIITPKVLARLSLQSSSLFTACTRGELNRVVSILQNNPELVNARLHTGMTPLHFAVMNPTQSNDIVVSILIKAGADIEAKDKHGWTPLFTAVAAGHASTAKLLIEAGADVNGGDIERLVQLLCALPNDDIDDIKDLLIKHGANWVK